MSSLPLKGVRVIDFSHSWAAPHCARLLADFGAEVIKVEYPRRLCLLRGAKKEQKAYDGHPGWFQVNRNKLSLTLDLNLERDKDILRDLVKVSDVFVENSRTGVLGKFGFSYEDMSALNSSLIMLSMPAFGNTGPFASYAAYGSVLEAMSGIQSLTAYEKSGKPARVKEVDTINGIVGASAIMTALVYRQSTGKGQHIDLSQLEASTHASIGEHLLEFAMNGRQTLPLGNRHREFAPQGCYRCKGEDNWVCITIRSDDQWRRFCEVCGHMEWCSDPRFKTVKARMINHDPLDELIEMWTVTQDKVEVMERLQEAGICVGAVLRGDEVKSNSHLRARNYFVQSEKEPEETYMGTPFKINQRSGIVSWRGPKLGEHNEYVACELLGRSSDKSQDEIPSYTEDEIGTAFDPVNES